MSERKARQLGIHRPVRIVASVVNSYVEHPDGAAENVSSIAIADQAAAAADLARGGKAAGCPAVVLTGLGAYVTDEDGPGVASLLRDRSEDLFGAN